MNLDNNIESNISYKLKNNCIYQEILCKLGEEEEIVRGSVIKLINEAGEYASNKLKTVIRHMPEFTLHDEEHIFKVLHIMGKIIPRETLKYLSVPELMLLILTAFFHDIGMAPDERYIRAWKGEWTNDSDGFEKDEYNKYQRFRNTYPQKIEEIERFQKNEQYSKANMIEEYLISEYIRITHAVRAREVIAKDWIEKITYKDTDLTNEFATICFSHNEDAMQLLNMDTFTLCNNNKYVCLPFIAVVLRIADIIDFDAKRTPEILFSHLSVRNPVSLSEWKKHQSINAWSISSDKLIFSAQCKHPAIEATIRKFCDLIDKELKDCNLILSSLNDTYIGENIKYYKIKLPPMVDRSKIGAVKNVLTGASIYEYHNTQFVLSKKQVIDLLMGTKLYGKPEVALRELIQNSIDACLVRQKMCEAWEEEYKPKIKVAFYTRENVDYLEVYDNGIGMNQHIIDNYYANVGSSFYKSREFYDMMSEINVKIKPISRFGIGILSCFMVSDSLEVNTRRVAGKYEYNDPLKVIIEGYDSIFYITESHRKEPGTTTVLQLRPVNPWSRMTDAEFVKSVKSIVRYPPFQIEIVTNSNQEFYRKEDFYKLKPSDLKKYQWREDDNIKEIEINISNNKYGFNGSAIVGIIYKDNEPVDTIEVLSKEIVIDNETYELGMSINYSENGIQKSSKTIDVNDDGEIETSSNQYVIAKSKSSFSIHGIDFPGTLFPEYYLERDIRSKIRWTFPIVLILDLGGNNDLNLNSARTEIIYDNKWMEFEKNLFYVVCEQLAVKLGKKKWKILKKILMKNIKDENLLIVLKDI